MSYSTYNIRLCLFLAYLSKQTFHIFQFYNPYLKAFKFVLLVWKKKRTQPKLFTHSLNWKPRSSNKGKPSAPLFGVQTDLSTYYLGLHGIWQVYMVKNYQIELYSANSLINSIWRWVSGASMILERGDWAYCRFILSKASSNDRCSKYM